MDDELVHRPVADWSISYFTSELNDATVWLCSSSSKPEEEVSLRSPVSRNYFLSLEKMTYNRDEPQPSQESELDQTVNQVDTPLHKVQIHNMKGSWTTSSRNIAFRLFDGYSKAQEMKRNLSSEALKGFKLDSTGQTPAVSQLFFESFENLPEMCFTDTNSKIKICFVDCS